MNEFDVGSLRILRDKSEAAGQSYVEFNVYASPEDDGVVFGYMNHFRVTGPREAAFDGTKFGVPVEEAFQNAVAYAKANGVQAIVISDPDQLFDSGSQ